MSENSQKFIARNRAPRVQIEYDVELYGSAKKVQLPFVMGVMSDLSGKSLIAQPDVADRSFLAIDVDNFDDRMKAMQPRVAFSVPNTLTGEGNLSVDLTFEKMEDFSPAAIALKVDSLRPLLEARSQLSDLMAYMDGKAGAETLIETILADTGLLSALSEASTDGIDSSAALASLRALTPPDVAQTDDQNVALASLATVEIAEPEADKTDDLLADLAATVSADATEPDATGDVLASLAAVDIAEDAADTTDDLLADLAVSASDDVDEADATGDALTSLAAVEMAEEPVENTDDLLADLAEIAPMDLAAPDVVGDVLGSLASVEIATAAPDGVDDLLSDLVDAAPEDVSETGAIDDVLEGLESADSDGAIADTTDDLLADLAAVAPEQNAATDDLTTALAELADVEIVSPKADDTDDLLAVLAADPLTDEVAADDTANVLDDLADLEIANEEDDTADDLAALLAGLGEDGADVSNDAKTAPQESDASDLDDLMAGLGDVSDGLEDLLADLEGDEPDVTADTGDASDLDDLLAGLGDVSDGLEDLLAGLGDDDPDTADDSVDAGLDDLMAGLGDVSDGLDDLLDGLGDDGETLDAIDDDLDDLLGGLGDDDPADVEDVKLQAPEFAYGQMSADRPAPERLNRKRFRLAILGDFSGRAARGLFETGDALAARAPILLDPDTVEDVIAGFATDLVLPIGKDGAGVAVKLGGLDDLHPDELYQNVALFAELVGLRGQLASGATADHAARTLRAWGEKHGTPVAPTRAKSSGNTVPADLKLSDFQKLIGDTKAVLTQPSPIEELLARVVGPYIRAIPDADAVAMQGAVDDALSAAMRMVLHHPEFQSVESQWRSLDLIARSIETDDTLDVILYDISAEEIAADLAMADDLAASGFARLLTEEPLDGENGRGGYSALIGLYSFEETPPHAELLARIARVAAHVDAPFFAAISPAFLDTETQDRHPLVATAWDTLRAMPEAKHLGLTTPRFLLRRPYGAKSEPIYEFEFEEFTMSAGLGGMLWANPVVLVAILLAKSFRENGASMGLGSIMSLGDMPFHLVTDTYGDQVALPCTERNLTLDKVEKAVVRGYMSVVSIKGRDEIRLASFQSLGGGEILGPWSGVAPPPPSPPKPTPVPRTPDIDETIEEEDELNLDDLLSDFADDGGTEDDTTNNDDLDADLAALLGDL